MKSTLTFLAIIASALTLKGVAAVALPVAQIVDELPDGQIGTFDKRAAAALAAPAIPAAPVFVPPPAPTNPGTSSYCTLWYTITAEDSQACQIALADGNMSLAAFRALNPFVNDGCTNLSVGYSYCIAARIAAPDFVKRHPKDIGIVAKAEDIEDCAPCDFYIRSVDEPEPAKREAELVKESEEEEEDCAPCDFYIRSEDSAERIRPTPVGPAQGSTLPEKRNVEVAAKREAELVKESEEEEEDCAPCDFYIRSEDSAEMIRPTPVGPAQGSTLPEKRNVEEPANRDTELAENSEDELTALWLVKKSEAVADEEDCAPCDFYIL